MFSYLQVILHDAFIYNRTERRNTPTFSVYLISHWLLSGGIISLICVWEHNFPVWIQ